jgi:bifunctional non-homologous end joining protein LigD
MATKKVELGPSSFLTIRRMLPLAELPPRDSRFGSPLKLSKVHWVKPELVVEVTYLTWTEDNLLRQVSYQWQREDKPARQVVRAVAHPRAK